MSYEQKNEIMFEIIRDLPACWGESPSIFSEFGRDEFVAEMAENPEAGWDWNAYPETETVTLNEMVEWLSSNHNQPFLLGNACVTPAEDKLIRAALTTL